MKRLLTVLFVLICTFASPAQDWRYMEGKKAFTSLDDALKNPTAVYNLSLGGRDIYKKDISGIRKMINLRYLALFDADLERLPSGLFNNLREIRTLNLVQNKFSKIPLEIRKLKKLEYLVMYDNEIDSIPDWIGELTNLETLILPRNKLVYIPPSIGELKKLNDLSVGDNLIEQLPAELGDLSGLKILELNENSLTELPGSITRLSYLEGLHLNNNKLVKLPADLGLLKQLENLQLGTNNLRSLPFSISELVRLDHLGLARNPELGFDNKLHLPTSLTQLSLEGKNIKEFPECLQYCINLERLELSQTSVEEIPVWLSHLTKLNWLILEDNRLKSVPAFLEKLVNLEILRLSGNKLDTIPAGLFLLPKLRGLSIRDNPVRHIPATIAASASLEWFNMNGTTVSYHEYKAIRKTITRKIEIGHDSPYFFEEERAPCYTEQFTESSGDRFFTHLESDPYFFGGNRKWHRFVQDNTDSTQILKSFGKDTLVKTDSVVVQFVVRKKGGISNLKIIYYGNEILRQQVEKVMMESCRYWVPSNMSGRNISAWFSQIFIFTISSSTGSAVMRITVKSPNTGNPFFRQ